MWLLQFAARYRDKHRPEDVSECMKSVMEIMKGTRSQTGKKMERNREEQDPEETSL